PAGFLKSIWREAFMVELNGNVAVENPAEALRNQDGIFQVTSPYGQVFEVTCRRGSNMHIREIGDSGKCQVSVPKLWQMHDMINQMCKIISVTASPDPIRQGVCNFDSGKRAITCAR